MMGGAPGQYVYETRGLGAQFLEAKGTLYVSRLNFLMFYSF